ncbi:MAG: DNA translocase FtsK 4TM domain-containing protein [Ottowia sp.]|nr:DNA translocase FtsK 4TM domain-containing protein [Ottowia sp.]
MTYPLNTFNSDDGIQARTGLLRFAGEIMLLAGLGALVFIALALLSYSPQDAAWSTSGAATGALHNRAGRAGAWIADVAYALMGYSAWWCVAAAAFAWALGLVSWMRGSVSRSGWRTGSLWAFWLGMALLLLTSCGLEWTRLHRWDGALPGDAGGVLGHVSGRLAVQWLGYTGSTLLELAALACALALVFRFSWGRLAERVGAVTYDLLTGQRVLGWLRDRLAGWRAARARAKELNRERVAVQEGAAPLLAPLTPLMPQAGGADKHVEGVRVEPALEVLDDAEAPAPTPATAIGSAAQRSMERCRAA